MWDPVSRTCTSNDVETSQLPFVALFITDFLLLLIMLVGLLRLRRGGGGTFKLGRLLWRQVGRQFSLAAMLLTH